MKRLLSFAFVLFLPSVAIAQTKYTAEQLQRHFQSVAGSYELVADGSKLNFRTQPLMYWRNPERQQDQGALYVWDRDGRPAVLASIFTYEYKGEVKCRHEAISLSDTPVTGKLDSQVVWSPTKPGLQWNELGDDPSVAETDSRRLFQMRSIARQFSGTLHSPNRQPAKLTLLPQPLVRYQAAKAGVIDGAIFSFAIGTDPELLLVLEARADAAGEPKYYFAAARSHYHELKLERGGVHVWSAPADMALETTQAGQSPYLKQPFFVFTPHRPLPPPQQLE